MTPLLLLALWSSVAVHFAESCGDMCYFCSHEMTAFKMEEPGSAKLTECYDRQMLQKKDHCPNKCSTRIEIQIENVRNLIIKKLTILRGCSKLFADKKMYCKNKLNAESTIQCVEICTGILCNKHLVKRTQVFPFCLTCKLYYKEMCPKKDQTAIVCPGMCVETIEYKLKKIIKVKQFCIIGKYGNSKFMVPNEVLVSKRGNSLLFSMCSSTTVVYCIHNVDTAKYLNNEYIKKENSFEKNEKPIICRICYSIRKSKQELGECEINANIVTVECLSNCFTISKEDSAMVSVQKGCHTRNIHSAIFGVNQTFMYINFRTHLGQTGPPQGIVSGYKYKYCTGSQSYPCNYAETADSILNSEGMTYDKSKKYVVDVDNFQNMDENNAVLESTYKTKYVSFSRDIVVHGSGYYLSEYMHSDMDVDKNFIGSWLFPIILAVSWLVGLTVVQSKVRIIIAQRKEAAKKVVEDASQSHAMSSHSNA